jgi:amino acid transporter
VPGIVIIVLITWVLVRGMRESASLNNALVVLKLAVLALFVMLGLPRTAWIRFGVWMAIGIAFYFAYNFRHSRPRETTAAD